MQISERGVPAMNRSRDDLASSEYILDPEEVGHILDQSPQHVTDLARTGKLRARRMGSHWKFSNRDVTAYRERRASIKSNS